MSRAALPLAGSTLTRSRSPDCRTVTFTWSGAPGSGNRETERIGGSAMTPTRILPVASAIAVAQAWSLWQVSESWSRLVTVT